MKKILYTLVGDKAGRVVTGTWNWLWGIPVESGGNIAVGVAKESLESMEESVAQLTKSVAEIMAAYEIVKSEYELKKQEFKEAENQAILAHQKGNESAARLYISKAISLENLLPKIAVKVEQMEKVVKLSQEKLRKEKENLELYKLEMQNLKSLHKINESLAKITDFDSSLNLQSAQDQFNDANQAIQGKNLIEDALFDLTQDSFEKIESELNQINLDDEINRRFQLLKNQD